MAKSPFDFDVSKFFDFGKMGQFGKMADFAKGMDMSKMFGNFSIPGVDMSKMFGNFNLPGVDIQSVLTSQRKNMEALTEANKLALEGMQAVFKRQAEDSPPIDRGRFGGDARSFRVRRGFAAGRDRETDGIGQDGLRKGSGERQGAFGDRRQGQRRSGRTAQQAVRSDARRIQGIRRQRQETLILACAGLPLGSPRRAEGLRSP